MTYTRVYRVKIHHIHPTLPPLETNRRLVHECWICRKGWGSANFKILEIDIEIDKNLHTTMKKNLKILMAYKGKKIQYGRKRFHKDYVYSSAGSFTRLLFEKCFNAGVLRR